MAVGDALVDLDDVSAASSIDFQPASGVEVLITGASSEANAALECILDQTDGTLNGLICDLLFSRANSSFNLKFFITNTVYLRRRNTTAGALAIGYSGVQTK